MPVSVMGLSSSKLTYPLTCPYMYVIKGLHHSGNYSTAPARQSTEVKLAWVHVKAVLGVSIGPTTSGGLRQSEFLVPPRGSHKGLSVPTIGTLAKLPSVQVQLHP